MADVRTNQSSGSIAIASAEAANSTLIVLLLFGTFGLCGIVTAFAWHATIEPLSMIKYCIELFPNSIEKVRAPVASTVLSCGLVMIMALLIAIFPKTRRDHKAHDLIYYLGFIGTIAGLLGASFVLVLENPSNAVNSGAAEAGNVVSDKTKDTVALIMAQNGVSLGTTLCGMVCRNLLRYGFPHHLGATEQMAKQLKELDGAAQAAISSLANMQTSLGNLVFEASGLTTSVKDSGSRLDESRPNWVRFGESAAGLQSNLAQSAGSIAAIAAALESLPRQTAAVSQSMSGNLENLSQRLAQLVDEFAALQQKISSVTTGSGRLAIQTPPPIYGSQSGANYGQPGPLRRN